MKVVDVHCHIDQYDESELTNILGGQPVIGAAMNKQSGDRLLEMSKRFAEMYVCLGIHPEYPEYYHEFNLVKKQILENQDKIIGIGEIGLPYYKMLDMNESDRQALTKRGFELLVKFMDLSQETKLPVVLHAIEDTAVVALEELKKRNIKKALFHWFEGPLDVLKSITESGYYISISPDILCNKHYAEFTTNLPIENLVLESDGPWQYGDRKGIPSMVNEIAEYITLTRGMDTEQFMDIVYQNTCKLFGRSF